MRARPNLTLPQPVIFRELYAMRLKVHGKAARLGWKRYLAEINERAGHLLGKSPVPSPAKPGHRPPLRPLGVLHKAPAARRTLPTQAC
ncbi:MAG TPA: hypothetical protein VL486_13325 [Verrucomicrobiae bacterium]|nr:hypothetical protein [Verrucomicrobiae bacterium]